MSTSPIQIGLTAESGADQFEFHLPFLALVRFLGLCSVNSGHRPADLVDTGDPIGTLGPGVGKVRRSFDPMQISPLQLIIYIIHFPGFVFDAALYFL